MELTEFSVEELLKLYSNLINELRKRNVLRSSNNPVADYAEYIIADRFGLQLQPNSNKGYDAIDPNTGVKYQIKSRRNTRFNHSTQLGVIRNLDVANFDFIIAVIFGEEFNLLKIYKFPRSIIKKYARFSDHLNGYILNLKKIQNDKEVELLNLD